MILQVGQCEAHLYVDIIVFVSVEVIVHCPGMGNDNYY